MAIAKRLIRNEILASATRLFSAQGVDATSLQQVADQVGIRKPSLLYHFPSKEALRLAVLDSLLSRWKEVVPRVLLAASSGMDQFEAIIEELVGFFSESPDRARLLLRELMDRPVEARERVREQVQPWIDMACRQVRSGQERGMVRADVDPEAYVFHVIQLVLASMATQDVLGVQPGERQRNELVRIARASLFVATD